MLLPCVFRVGGGCLAHVLCASLAPPLQAVPALTAFNKIGEMDMNAIKAAIAAHERANRRALPWEEGPMAAIFGGPLFAPMQPRVQPALAAWLAQDGGIEIPSGAESVEVRMGLRRKRDGLAPNLADSMARRKAMRRWREMVGGMSDA